MSVLTDENRYWILKLLEQNPSLSQRELADAMGISLGKTNYCLNVLIGNGLVKSDHARGGNGRQPHAYYLTSEGRQEKRRVTLQYLAHKQQELETLAGELEELQREVAELKLEQDGE